MAERSSSPATAGDTFDIYVMSADGSNVRRLTSASEDEVSPVWAPDGRSIVFARRGAGRSDLYEMHPDGTRLTRILRLNGPVTIESWQPVVDKTAPTVNALSVSRISKHALVVRAHVLDASGWAMAIVNADDPSQGYVATATSIGRANAQTTRAIPLTTAPATSLHLDVCLAATDPTGNRQKTCKIFDIPDA